MHDIVIRGGTIIDGTGRTPFTGDVAIDGERIVEAGRRLGDVSELFGPHVVDVLVERGPGVDLVADAVEHRHQDRRERQVRVRRAVGQAELDPLRLGAGRVDRNADRRRAISLASDVAESGRTRTPRTD